ncbi:hypothetical protein Q7C36_022771 [Tachysurus vachellii]|uniref:Uncharacterized protein n=1 Tax=Tachysurus vachellii TaxID=175792 RepID=A0AA88IM42_TACVA|nr:hypothetical protein Q7C36_022771 [Tachysurus vachellii]
MGSVSPVVDIVHTKYKMHSHVFEDTAPLYGPVEDASRQPGGERFLLPVEDVALFPDLAKEAIWPILVELQT